MSGRPATFATIAALIFGTAWLLLYPPLTHLPTSDLYGHLSVARHLVRGDGFLNDVVYPLSLAFPHAAAVPQPLIHRGPAYPLLLCSAVWIGDQESGKTLAAVRWLHLLMLLLTVWIGARRLCREGLAEAIGAWLLLLGGSPLLAMSVGWGYVEVPAALLLLGLWLRWRSGTVCGVAGATNGIGRPPGAAAGAVDGTFAAGLTLLRLDLFWIPIAWWLTKRRHAGWRPAAIGLAVWLLLMSPWAVRSYQLTGSPFFSLQAYGEHLKQTPQWPEYTIYRSLQPEAFWTTLAKQPGIVLAKSAAGLRFFLTQLGNWLPWTIWAACLLLLVRNWRNRRRSRAIAWIRQSDLLLPLLTLGLLVLQYAVFSHTLRHLLILLPIVTWEICLAAGSWLRDKRPGWRRFGRAGLLTAIALAALILTPPRLPGWSGALRQAELSAQAVNEAVADLLAQPDGPVFTDSAVLLWRGDRAGVWSPLNQEVEAEIRRRVPSMAQARWIRLGQAASDQNPGDWLDE